MQVLQAFERTLSGTKSEALLIWPQRPDCIAVFHALASLNCISTCDSEGLVTLYFPWNRNTPATQRNLLVDRNFIYEATLPVLNRLINTSEDHPAFGYIMALHSLRYLPEKRKKDSRFMKALNADPGLIHPTLFEIMPQLGVQRDCLHEYQDQFLRRLSRHTWITEDKKYIESAIDPLHAPFYMFGVHPDAIRLKDVRSAGLSIQSDGRRPDIVLMDLTYRARNRLGKNWQQSLSRFLGVVGELFGTNSPPVFAVTDDVYVLQRLRWDALKAYDKDRGAQMLGRRPATSQVSLHFKPHVLDHAAVVHRSAPHIATEIYGSDVLHFVDLGLKLRQSLLNVGDAELASAVTTAFTSAQNIVGLPGPVRQFHDFLADYYEGYEQQYYGSRFDYVAPRSRIKLALQQGLGGVNQDKLRDFFDAFEKIYDSADAQTPGSVLFEQCIIKISEREERSLVIFSNEVLLGFAEWRIENDVSLTHVNPLLGRKIMLSSRREAIEELDLNEDERSPYHQVVFFEPRPEDLLHMLVQPWAPEKVLVLANLASAKYTLDRLRILLKIKGIEPIRENLSAIEGELTRAISGRAVEIPDHDLAPPMPRLGTLDLTGIESGVPNTEKTRTIKTSGNLQIRALDGSEMALYDADALQPFSLKLAKDLKPGNEICVLSPDFVNMAREKLNFTANASDVLSLYHSAVADAVNALPGIDLTSKVQAVRKEMLTLEPGIVLPGNQAMRQWIDVVGLIDTPRNEVRPQAPRDRRHYLCFMRTLGISDDAARHYWDWGIVWTRSIRISRGSTFRQTFMGILIDPHGVMSHLPAERRKDVLRIHEAAEHHVVTVISNKREGNP